MANQLKFQVYYDEWCHFYLLVSLFTVYVLRWFFNTKYAVHLKIFIMINIIEENHNLTWCDLEWESALMHINTSGCP